MKADRQQWWWRAASAVCVLALLVVAIYRWVEHSPAKATMATAMQQTLNAGAGVGVIKSPNDKRDYQYLTLANGLKVLLVSDPTADMAAAALDVATGSRDDPAKRQGLAHFLEHMLFLGTAKYPKPDEYQAFVSAHGGQHNAYTSLEHTNYFFDIDPTHFPEALDRFSQFFTAPLFTEAYVQREKNAVDSEYQARIRDDGRRLWDVYRELYDEHNPAARFAVGSLSTLSDNEGRAVRDDLVRFWEDHYSANTMRLVVLGPQSLKGLRELVTTHFSAIPNRQRVLDDKPYPVFPSGFLPARVDVQSVQDRHVLHLVFPMPSVLPHYRKKPEQFLAYLLGHEGEGSLYQTLRQRGWADRLSAGTGLSNRAGATFDVGIELTTAGVAHQDDVVMLFFQAVNAVKKSGITQAYFDEQKHLLDLSFQYVEKQAPVDYVSDLASAMQTFAPEDALRGNYLMQAFDAPLIQDSLAYITPQNLLLIKTSPDAVSGDSQTSQFYATPYKVAAMPSELVSLWSGAHLFTGMGVPARNPFVPEQLKLKPVPMFNRHAKGVPANIAHGKRYDLWFQQDSQFKVPKASIMVYARSPFLSATARDAVKAELFVRLLNDHLNPMLYSAGQAGLDFVIAKRSRGIAFQLTGFSDKQGLLLKSVLETFRSPVFSEDRFKLVKDQYARELQNAVKQTPYQQLIQDVPVTLVHGYWNRERIAQELSSITLPEVQNYVLDYTQALVADILVYGNVYQADALKLGQVIENALNIDDRPVQDLAARVVELPPMSDPLLYIDPLQHNDSAVVKYFQAAGDDIPSQVKTALLAQLLKAAFFNALRTEQQTGYIVNCASLPLARVPGIAFLVQSPVVGAGDIHHRINDFMKQYYQVIEQMPDEAFESQRQALLVQLSEKPKNLAEQAMLYWTDMTLDYTGFDYREQQVAVLKTLTKQDMLAFYRDMLLQKNRRELLVVSPGKVGIKNLLDGSPEQYLLVDDVDKIKSSFSSHVLQ